jgi:hypothetical protein
MRNDNLGPLVEALVAKWLRESDLGQSILVEMTLDAAIDAAFELMNLGIIKLTGTRGKITGIEVCETPRPPLRTVFRPGSRRH